MRSTVFLLALLMHVAPVYAQQTGSRLTLADAVAEALRTHPEIAAAQRRHDAALQRPAQERSRPDPMLSAGWASTGNPLPGAGLGTDPTANIGFMVSQEFSYRGKRDARAAVTAREADAESQAIEAARLSVASRVKQSYYSLAYVRAASAVVERNRELLQTLVKVAEQRYAVGQAAQQDVIKAQTELSLIELQQRRMLRTVRSREGELNALLSRLPGSPIGPVEDLTLPAFDLSLDDLLRRVAATSPLLKRDQLMVERAKLAADSARLDYKPDFTVSGGYGYAGRMPDMYEFRVDFNIPLRRARRSSAVAEQASLAAAAEKTVEATRLDLQGRLQEDYEMVSASLRLASLYRDTVLPQARLALESSLASYQTGRVDFLSVLTNFATVLEYEMTYFEELAELHRALSRLEEMTGTPIPH